MKDYEKQIEEVAKNFSNIYSERELFIDGAKSEAAKEYWQQGMCSEEEVFILIEKIYRTGIYQRETYNKSMNLTEWFDNNKKK